MLIADEIEGWMFGEELDWLREQASRHAVTVELGAWHGRSTHALASCSRGTVFTVDHFMGSASERQGAHAQATTPEGRQQVRRAFLDNLAPFIASGRLFLLELDAAVAASFLKTLLAARGGADFVFLDGDQDYPAVASDIRNYLEVVRPGGLVAGHDAVWPGVRQALDELLPGWQPGPGSIWFRNR